MTFRLSFILPCYNVERYIADCLNSIYAQGLLESEFEVICVNDCSTDGTRNIILEYSKVHDNLFLIDHTRNLTAGGARNTGIDNAKGEYIWFVDPDDMVKANMAEPLYEKASTNNLDILFFNNDIVDEHLSYLKTENVFVDTETLSGQDYMVRYFRNQISKLCIVWRCMIRTTFLKNNVLSFPHMRKAEDVAFLWKATSLASSVASVKDVGYVYRSNPYSVANKTPSASVLFSERALFANEILDLLNDTEIEIQQPIRDEMQRALVWCVNSCIDRLSKMPLDKQARFYDEIVSHKIIVNRLKPFMNRKYKLFFSTFGGKWFWMRKTQWLCR
jgi:glycosyltransferase involved in cell wall biosynthesis